MQIKNGAGEKKEERKNIVRNHQAVDHLDHGSLQCTRTQAGHRHIV